MTRIIVDLPIEPGAKTCEGCPHYWRLPSVCSLFSGAHGEQLMITDDQRLPECLAAERVQTGECWRIYDADGDHWEDCLTSRYAWEEVDAQGMRGGARVFHATRWRKP